MEDKLPKITYTWTQTWKNDWVWGEQSEMTGLLLMAYDLLEYDVEDSKNKQAIKMLEAIGIKCNP